MFLDPKRNAMAEVFWLGGFVSQSGETIFFIRRLPTSQSFRAALNMKCKVSDQTAGALKLFQPIENLFFFKGRKSCDFELRKKFVHLLFKKLQALKVDAV